MTRFAVGYIRVSSAKQEASGLSMAHQREKVCGWSALYGVPLELIYEDAAESAKNLDRPDVQAIIARVQRGEISHIVVYKLDRLTRSIADLDLLLRLVQKHDVALVSVTENLDTSTATGRMMVNIIGVFAQWEREQISERTIAALDVKRSRGEKLGGECPFGFMVDGKMLVPNPGEVSVLESILSMRRAGASLTTICEKLNSAGTKPRSGVKWHVSTIRGICLRAGLPPR